MYTGDAPKAQWPPAPARCRRRRSRRSLTPRSRCARSATDSPLAPAPRHRLKMTQTALLGMLDQRNALESRAEIMRANCGRPINSNSTVPDTRRIVPCTVGGDWRAPRVDQPRDAQSSPVRPHHRHPCCHRRSRRLASDRWRYRCWRCRRCVAPPDGSMRRESAPPPPPPPPIARASAAALRLMCNVIEAAWAERCNHTMASPVQK
jgi:hypothetical protein